MSSGPDEFRLHGQGSFQPSWDSDQVKSAHVEVFSQDTDWSHYCGLQYGVTRSYKIFILRVPVIYVFWVKSHTQSETPQLCNYKTVDRTHTTNWYTLLDVDFQGSCELQNRLIGGGGGGQLSCIALHWPTIKWAHPSIQLRYIRGVKTSLIMRKYSLPAEFFLIDMTNHTPKLARIVLSRLPPRRRQQIPVAQVQTPQASSSLAAAGNKLLAASRITKKQEQQLCILPAT